MWNTRNFFVQINPSCWNGYADELILPTQKFCIFIKPWRKVSNPIAVKIASNPRREGERVVGSRQYVQIRLSVKVDFLSLRLREESSSVQSFSRMAFHAPEPGMHAQFGWASHSNRYILASALWRNVSLQTQSIYRVGGVNFKIVVLSFQKLGNLFGSVTCHSHAKWQNWNAT